MSEKQILKCGKKHFNPKCEKNYSKYRNCKSILENSKIRIR